MLSWPLSHQATTLASGEAAQLKSRALPKVDTCSLRLSTRDGVSRLPSAS